MFSRKSKLNRNIPNKRLSKYYYHYSIYFCTYKSFFNQNSTWSTRKNFSIITIQYPSLDTCTQNNSIQAFNTPHSDVIMRTTNDIFEIVAKRSINIHRANGGYAISSVEITKIKSTEDTNRILLDALSHNRDNNKAWERLCTLCDLRSPVASRRFIADVSLGQRGSHPKSSVVPRSPGITFPFHTFLSSICWCDYRC